MGGHPISGLPEIGIINAQVGYPPLMSGGVVGIGNESFGSAHRDVSNELQRLITLLHLRRIDYWRIVWPCPLGKKSILLSALEKAVHFG